MLLKIHLKNYIVNLKNQPVTEWDINVMINLLLKKNHINLIYLKNVKKPDNRKSIITEFENHINKLDIFKKFKTNNTPTEIRLINGKT